MIKYSVIVPVYNKEEYLEECIESVLNQRIANFEILLINDGSKDNSLEICNRLAAKDNRITVIDKTNSGVSDTRNLGIDRANGDYILFLDADDIWSSDLLSKVDKNIEDNDILIFRSCRDKKMLDSEATENIVHLDDRDSILKSIVYNQDSIKCCRANFNRVTDYVVRTEILRNNSVRFNRELKIGEDKLFNFGLMQIVNKVSYLNQYLYYIRTNNKSVMGSYNKEAFELNIKMLEHFLNEINSISNHKLKDDLDALSKCMEFQVVWNTITSDICHKDNPNSYKCRKESYEKCKKHLKIECLNSLKQYDQYLFKVFKNPFCTMNIIMKNRIVRGICFYCCRLMKGKVAA